MEALGINLGYLIAHIINFVLIFGLLGAVMWKPLLNTLEKRRETIEKGLEDARVAQEARKNAEVEAEKIRAEARTEAARIVADARGRAEEAGKDVTAQAHTDADAIRTEARAKSEDEKNAMLSDMRGQVAALAIAAAKQLIGEGMDEKRQQAIVADFFAKSPAGVKGLGSNIAVVSALPLTDDEKKKVLSETGASSADWKVDPNILGGLIIRAGDQLVDGSVRTRLGALGSRLN